MRYSLLLRKHVPEALSAYLRPENIKMFEQLEIFNHKELHGRVEVEYEKFIKKIQIESRVLGDLAINHIVPVAVKYQTMLLENVRYMKEVFTEAEFEEMASGRKNLIKEIGRHVSTIKAKVNDMIEARKKANVIDDVIEKAKAYDETVFPYLADIRYHIDKLELVVDNELWPLPKYRELLFIR